MDLDDIKFCQEYFRSEQPRPHHHRDPDDRHLLVRSLPPHHLRHHIWTTCRSTMPVVQAAYDRYLATRAEVWAVRRSPA